jgi:hypothetical protein
LPIPAERELINRLLQACFPGRDEVASALDHVEVRTLDEMGSLELRPAVARKSPVVKRIPVEAEAKDSDGYTIHVLLHVVDGQPIELEIYKDDGSRIVQMPPASSFELLVLPPAPSRRIQD